MLEKLTHLKQLEAESIHIIREVAAEFKNPVMQYGLGKSPAAMVQRARKACHAGRLPFPVIHADTGWKCSDMYSSRERRVQEIDLDLVVHTSPVVVAQSIGPFT